MRLLRLKLCSRGLSLVAMALLCHLALCVIDFYGFSFGWPEAVKKQVPALDKKISDKKEADIKTANKPGVPRDLSAFPLTSYSAYIYWQPGSGAVDKYELYKATAGLISPAGIPGGINQATTGFFKIAELPENTTFYIDYKITDVSAFYRLCAVNTTNELKIPLVSDFSEPVVVSFMAEIPAGSFSMGIDTATHPEASEIEGPAHPVMLSSFFTDLYEVANADYCSFLNSYGKETDGEGNKMLYYGNDPGVKNPGIEKSAEGVFYTLPGYGFLPVSCVTWYGAREFAEYYGKRLPTEAEWEKAARGTGERIFPWGGVSIDSATINGSFLNYNNVIASPTVVGSYSSGKSPYGLYDLAGNLWEFCMDWYSAGYYSVSPGTDPPGSDTGSAKVIRGGGYKSSATDCRVTRRESTAPFGPEARSGEIGFRCVK